MKKARLFLFFLFLLPTFLIGQYNFGLKGGLNYSTLSEDPSIFNPPTELYDYATRYHVGIFGEYFFSSKVGIRAEAMYSYQGAKKHRWQSHFF